MSLFSRLSLLGLALILAAGPAFCQSPVYPSSPYYLNSGKLRCGLRLLAADQFQLWCWVLPGFKLIENGLHPIAAGDVVDVAVVHGPDHVRVVVSNLDGAMPFQYQINVGGADAWKQGVLGDLDPAMPGRLVLAGSVCRYFCCALPDPATAAWEDSGTPRPSRNLLVSFALASFSCPPAN